MSPSSGLSCETRSFSHYCTSHSFLQPEVFETLFSLHWNSGLCGLSQSPVLPPGLSARDCGTTRSTSLLLYLLPLPVCQLQPCHTSSPPCLPISAPPTSVDTCLFFNSLVVALPYSLIFLQFWLFLFLNWLSSFWFCEEAKCIYLCLQLGQKSQMFSFFKILVIYFFRERGMEGER